MLQNYAVPAFNFYNLESFRAIFRAASETGKTVIYAASPSAIKYMGDEFLKDFAAGRCWLHLDHGRSLDDAKHAIALGFRSVMIDGSALSFDENVRLTKSVVKYAHARGVFVEAELGVLCGREADAPIGAANCTDPAQAKKFVDLTGCDSLAVAIGTSHGAYKGNGKLRLDILKEIRKLLPRKPLVLHGASQIPQKYAKILKLKKAAGISASAIRGAVKAGINTVNVDSDARLAWTAAVKQMFQKNPDEFDPRKILAAASVEMTELYKREIKIICG
jgi:fructose-bisphosphate aldolase class II